jgi:predicted MFS family arabinose efflux permease
MSSAENQIGAQTSVAAPAWLAVGSLAISTFASVTCEFLPVGLLTNIASSLNVSEGTAGLMVTLPGVTAALAGPVLLTASGRLDRRAVLLVLSALLVLSNVLAALAPNLATMLFARVLLGLCVGGFWTFAPSATGHLVPSVMQPKAMSYILAGISVATVAGVPAGALLGNFAGWRVAFAVSAVLAAAVLVLQLRVLPALPAARAISPRDLLEPFTRVSARLGLVVTFFLVAGHFAGYTYLRPMFQQMFGLTGDAVVSLLLIYGTAGFVGTLVAGRLVARNARAVALLAAAVIAGVLFTCVVVGDGRLDGGLITAGMASLVWGAAFGLVPLSMTGWMLEALPQAQESGQAMLVTFFQLAISLGALLGGGVFDARGIVSTLQLGGASCLLAVAVIAATLLTQR